MKRILALAVAVPLITLAGCGSAGGTASSQTTVTALRTGTPTTEAAPPAPGPAPTPARPGATVAGIPALSGAPTDLKAQSSGQAGTGQPPTQLLTQDVVVGQGAAAKASDTVSIRYSGTLYDGTAFDASWKKGAAPVTYPLDQFVPGFSQGIVGMQPGGRRVMVIPPDLGYGAEAQGPVPANATLVFVVDLVGVS